VPQRQPHRALTELRKTLHDCMRLAADANRWSAAGSRPRISRKRSESMMELAFFRAYLAWEAFLEESFVCYLLGMAAPRRSAPKRFTFPPSRREAKAWLVPEGRRYTSWDSNAVRSRSQRYFRGGKPFHAALSSHQNALDQTKIVRNAIAHQSDSARDKFKNLARSMLQGTVPPGLTIGRFLNTQLPGSVPPETFFEYYIEKLEFIAGRIVPT
jgi:hypothetical protein